MGTVSALRGEFATITCGNHGDVNLVLNRDSHLQMGRVVDVVGKVVEAEGVSNFIFYFLLYAAFRSGRAGSSSR